MNDFALNLPKDTIYQFQQTLMLLYASVWKQSDGYFYSIFIGGHDL